MNRTLLAGATLLAIPVLAAAPPALGAAPPPGSAQADMMEPYADWIRGLTNPATGLACCSLSDCRVVDYRLNGDGYEAFIDRRTFPDGPDAWVKVPDVVVVRAPNPTGLAVACWAAWHKESSGWFCFTPSSGA